MLANKLRAKNKSLAQRIKEAQLKIKQEQIRKGKKEASMIKGLIEENKQLLNKTVVKELKTDLLKHSALALYDKFNNKKEKSLSKNLNKSQSSALNGPMSTDIHAETNHNVIVHKKRVSAMMNQADRLTRNIVSEENQNRALNQKLREYANKNHESKRGRSR